MPGCAHDQQLKAQAKHSNQERTRSNKGILVTTADYGPDAYEFAKDKPLTLLSGNNLLHHLAKHGHQARIDLKEAKQILQNSVR